MERKFREARGFKRRLDILVEIDDVRYKLRVRLRLVPSAHNAEGNSDLIFLHERGDDRVQRTLVTCERIRRSWIEAEQRAAVMENESGAVGDQSRAEFRVVRFDQRDHVAFTIDDVQISRIA